MEELDRETIIRKIRTFTNSPELTDDELWEIYNDSSSIFDAARIVWLNLAAKTSTLGNISESGSSRTLADVHKNALTMAAYYGNLHDKQNNVEAVRRGRVNYIERP